MERPPSGLISCLRRSILCLTRVASALPQPLAANCVGPGSATAGRQAHDHRISSLRPAGRHEWLGFNVVLWGLGGGYRGSDRRKPRCCPGRSGSVAHVPSLATVCVPPGKAHRCGSLRTDVDGFSPRVIQSAGFVGLIGSTRCRWP